MFKQILTLAAVAMVSPLLAGEGWLTNLEDAKKQAASEKKDLLIEFTGSDWCPPCKTLKEKVFSKKEFTDFANKDFVLVELDYPKAATQDEATKKANEVWSKTYKVQGFPSIIFASADGKPYGGFMGGRDSIPEVQKIMTEAQENKASFSKAIDVAKGLSGTAKAEALFKAYSTLPKEYLSFYGDLEKEIIALDPSDKVGLVKAANQQALSEKEKAEISTALRQLNLTKPEEALTSVNELLSKEFTDGSKALLQGVKHQILLRSGKFDESLACLDEIFKLAPESEDAKRAEQIKAAMIANKDKIMQQINAQKEAK